MKYEKLSQEECAKRGILGRLVGPIADFKRPTRNGRFYSEKLWEKFFSDPITKEKIKEKVFVGELGHPADRTEVDMEKIAICLSETPTKGNDGRLYGVFDILDTPNGRILKTLCDYGSHIGVSSRGTGDTVEDYNGNESVDADTFECECWDAVLVPAVKEARLKYVTESLGSKTLKQALMESLEKASDDDKRVMKETLDELNIDINNPEKDLDIEEGAEVESDASTAADNDGANVVNDLQEALGENENLRNQVAALQEQLSVCYAKETKLSEENTRYRNAIISLGRESKQSRANEKRVDELSEALNQKDCEIKALRESISKKDDSIQQLQEHNRTLHRKLNSSTLQVKSLTESVEKRKQTANETESLKKENATLQESIVNMKRNSAVLQKRHEEELKAVKEKSLSESTKSAKTIERYKQSYSVLIERYVEMKAIQFGTSAKAIMQALPKDPSIEDIDRLCESAENNHINIGRLPLELVSRKVQLNESDGHVEKGVKSKLFDDQVDDTILSFLN